MWFVTCCNLVETFLLQIDFRKYLWNSLPFSLSISLQNYNTGITALMTAWKQNNLSTMRLFLLHPLDTTSHRIRGGTWKKKTNKRLADLKRKTYWLVNWHPCAEAKTSKEDILQFGVLKSHLQVWHVAEINWLQPETIQSEH